MPTVSTVGFSAIAAIEGSQARRLYGDDLPLSVQGPLTGPCGRLERVNPTLIGRSDFWEADFQLQVPRHTADRRCDPVSRLNSNS